VKKFFLFLISLYRFSASPLLGPCCRFQPSCSCYAEEAIKEKGVINGIKLAVKRLLKCHPFHPGGFDPLEK